MACRLNTEVIPISAVEGIPTTEPRFPVVLVVDDEEIVADTLALILDQAGFCAVKAYGAQDALAKARQTPPDLLLTDVQMPRMNGVELALEVVRERPECQVLLFSGHATYGDLAPMKIKGYNFPLLTKPLHPTELLERIAGSLESGVRLNRPVAR
jgi:YesN/AraC family two-component response regulator